MPQAAERNRPVFLPSNAARLARKQPRRPHFLLEPVPSQRPLGCGTLGGKGYAVWSQGGWPPSFLLLRRVLRPDQLLPSLCLGLRHRGRATQVWPSPQALP